MKPKRDTYATVTNSIIEALGRGVAPWVRPWSNTEGSDRNGETQRPYNGINVILTMWSSLIFGYQSNEWFTYNQVHKLGGNVKRGTHGTMLVLFKPMEIQELNEKTGKMERKKIPLIREFHVFNRDQCEKLPPAKPIAPMNEDARDESIDSWIQRINAKLVSKKRSTVACYMPFTDTIEMPPMKTFTSSEAYYSTLFHEHTHWTGHESRLDRDLKNGFGTEAYAYEELVAELGSAFLCSEFRVNGALQHPEYIGHWIQKLQDDKKLIFSAASKARAAVEFLKGEVADTVEMDDEEAA